MFRFARDPPGSSTRMPWALFAATMVGALVIGAIVALATGNWLFLLWALAAHLIGASVVLLYMAWTSSPAEPKAAQLARREQERVDELRRRGERIARSRTRRARGRRTR
jgi:membrane protein implicated in regulation of membrane protease activity